MSASLVGSEMCIRDRGAGWSERFSVARPAPEPESELGEWELIGANLSKACLLYTSDAADDM
eukprot:15106895-Alexandrium_andersonii.AAC.1